MRYASDIPKDRGCERTWLFRLSRRGHHAETQWTASASSTIRSRCLKVKNDHDAEAVTVRRQWGQVLVISMTDIACRNPARFATAASCCATAAVEASPTAPH